MAGPRGNSPIATRIIGDRRRARAEAWISLSIEKVTPSVHDGSHHHLENTPHAVVSPYRAITELTASRGLPFVPRPVVRVILRQPRASWIVLPSSPAIL